MNSKVIAASMSFVAASVLSVFLAPGSVVHAESITVQSQIDFPSKEVLMCELSMNTQGAKKQILSTIYTDINFDILNNHTDNNMNGPVIGQPYARDCNGSYRLSFVRRNGLNDRKYLDLKTWHIYVYSNVYSKSVYAYEDKFYDAESFAKDYRAGRISKNQNIHFHSRITSNDSQISVDCKIKDFSTQELMEVLNVASSKYSVDPNGPTIICPAKK